MPTVGVSAFGRLPILAGTSPMVKIKRNGASVGTETNGIISLIIVAAQEGF